MNMPLQLVFFGELIEGFSVDEVRRNLAQSFKLGDEQLDKMFGGSAVVLKRNLASDEAARYVAHLAGLGARAQMRPMPVAANTPSYKTEPSVLSPLPRLVSSDGPLDAQPMRGDAGYGSGLPGSDAATHADFRTTGSTTAEAAVPLRPTTPGTAPPWAGPQLARPAAPATWAPIDPAEPFAPTAPLPVPLSPSLSSSASAPFTATAPAPLMAVERDAGPSSFVSSQPREAEIACPKCGERQPMRVLCRNCATNMEMAFAAQAEEEAKTRAERIDAVRARRGLPPSGFGASGHAHSRLRPGAGEPPPLWGVGWDGRIGRLNYATAIFATWAVMTLVSIVTHRMPAALGATLAALASIAMSAMSIRQTALRFHDRGHSGWWNLLLAAPYVVIALAFVSPRVGMRLLIPALLLMCGTLVYLLFFRGDDDDNAHGSPPREGSGGALLGSIIAFLALGALAPTDSALGGRLFNLGQDDAAVAGRLRSQEAKRAYISEYLLAGDHKAFAASPDGSWGWVAEAKSDDAAMTEALGTCDKHRPATQRPCELVSVNGRPVGLN